MVITDPDTCVFKNQMWTVFTTSSLCGILIILNGIQSYEIFGVAILAMTGMVFFLNRKHYINKQEYAISN